MATPDPLVRAAGTAVTRHRLLPDARDHGVEVRPPCINASRWDCTLAPTGGRLLAVRLGLRQVRGLSNADAAAIIGARSTADFDSVEDVWRRSGVQRAAIEKLADADAIHSFGADRWQGLWKVRGLGEAPLPLFAAADRAASTMSAEPKAAAVRSRTAFKLQRGPQVGASCRNTVLKRDTRPVV